MGERHGRQAEGRPVGPAGVAVAVSGGRDSLGLLHATVRAAEVLGLRVVALHVHHGLMPEADVWADDLRSLCERWTAAGRPLEFAGARLSGGPPAGESVEAWARRERYSALARMATRSGVDLVLLGHHRSDQAETVLLQALRGAGPAGLAAMPGRVVRAGITWARPWLDQPATAIADYVAAVGLDFVVDPSNADPRFARSRLRRAVMPALSNAFPDAETALVAVARRAQEARAVLDEVAAEDLQRIGAGDQLPLAPWRMLASARRANALRAWLASRVSNGVPDTLVQRLMAETGDDASRRWPLGAQQGLRSWRGLLAVVTMQALPPRAKIDPDIAPASSVPLETRLALLRCADVAVIGWRGHLEVFATPARGIAPHRLAHVVARARCGGERFQRAPASVARSLKKQFQDAGVAAEDRGGPLLFDEQGVLLFVPGLGIDARVWALSGQPQWGLRWHADARTGSLAELALD